MWGGLLFAHGKAEYLTGFAGGSASLSLKRMVESPFLPELWEKIRWPVLSSLAAPRSGLAREGKMPCEASGLDLVVP